MKKILPIILLVSLLSLSFKFCIAQDAPNMKLDYKEDLILDSDLDGLTDLGEKEIFKTDPLNPDSDNDGFYDGSEIISETDPLSNISPAATKTINDKTNLIENEIPWAWYIVRVTGLLSFALLYVVMFLGLSIRTPFLNKLIKPINSLNIHAWLSVQALILVFVHGGMLLLDKYAQFNVGDILVPFLNKTYGWELAAGIMAMYLMIALIVSSYLKRFISYKLWRGIHFLNIVLYFMAVYHGLALGTDLARGVVRSIFIGANIFLIIIIIINIVSRIIKVIQRKRSQL